MAPVSEIHAAANEMLREVAKARKKAEGHASSRKSVGVLTRFTSSLVSKSAPTSPGTPTAPRLNASSPSIRGLTERRRAPTAGSGGSSNTKAQHPVFGVSLDEVMARQRMGKATSFSVPALVRDGVSYILRKGLSVEGIFRLSGAKGEVDALREAYDFEMDVDLNNVRDPNVVASLLKQYLREMPEPLLPAKDYQRYLAAVQLASKEAVVTELGALIKEGVSGYNLAVLSEFVRLLHCVVRNSRFNKMNSANCSIVLGPNILRQPMSDPADVRMSAAFAMDSQDVNRVAEVLIDNPELVTSLEERSKDAPTASFVTKIVAHQKTVLSIGRLSETLLASVDSSGCVCLWDVASHSFVSSFECGWRPMGSCAAAGKVWLYGQKGVEVRDVDGTVLFSKLDAPFFSCMYIPGLNQVWLGTDRAVLVLNAVSYAEMGRCVGGSELVFCMCYVDSLNEVWGGGLDNSVAIFDASTWTLKQIVPDAFKKRVNHLVTAKNSAAVYSATEDGLVTIWDPVSRALVDSVAAHAARCNSVAVVGKQVWTAGWDTTINIHDLEMNLLYTLSGYHDDAVLALLNIDDTHVWSVSGDKGVAVWRSHIQGE